MKELTLLIWSTHIRQKENAFSVIVLLNLNLAVLQAVEGFFNNKVLILTRVHVYIILLPVELIISATLDNINM